MKSTSLVLPFFSAALLLLTQGVTAQQGNAPVATPTEQASPASADARRRSATLDRPDRQFLVEAAEGGLAEVELGRLAAQKAQSAEVRAFAQQMVNEHSAANAELKQIASAHGISLPTAVDSRHKREIDKLSKESGTDFDHKYVESQVKDHDQTVKKFEKYVAKAGNDDLKRFAEKTLPTLKDHQHKIHALAEQTGSKK
jgi:putative membrane protein